MSSRKALTKGNQKFPKTLYVERMGGLSEDPYFVSHENIIDIDDGNLVAIYELIEVRPKIVEHIVEHSLA